MLCEALAGWLQFGAGTDAAAQASRTSSPGTAVRVVYAASDELAGELERTLRAESRLAGARAKVERAASIDPTQLLLLRPEGPGALARIFVDVTRADRAWVFVVGRDSSRMFARSLPRVGSAAVELAQIGEIVRSSVQALALGAQIGLSPPSLPPVQTATAEPAIPAPPRAAAIAATQTQTQPDAATRASTAVRAPPPWAARRALPSTAAQTGPTPDQSTSLPTAAQPHASDDAGLHWLVGLLYGIGARSTGGELAHGPGVYTGLRFGRSVLRGGGLVSAQFEPRRIARAGLTAQLSSFVLRAGPSVDWRVGAHSALGFAVFAGTELLRAAVQTSRADWIIDSQQASFVALARLGGQMSLHLRAPGHLELAVSLVGDVDLVDTRFVVRSQLGDAVIDRPWRVRPSLVLALGWY